MTRNLHIIVQMLALFGQFALPDWLAALGLSGGAWDKAIHSTIGFVQAAVGIYAQGFNPSGTRSMEPVVTAQEVRAPAPPADDHRP